MTLEVQELKGHQFARTSLIQPGEIDPTVIPFCELVGYDLLDWQKHVIENLTSTRPNGKWAAREGLILVPRQNGKSLILMLIMLHRALIMPNQEILFSAHDFRTSVDLWNMMVGVANNVRLIEKKVKRLWSSSAERKILFDNGSTIRMISRTIHAGRGMHPDLLVLDEAFSVISQIVAAIMPAQASRVNPQVIWASSAGETNSLELMKLRQRLHGGKDKWLSGWDWWADPRSDITDPNTWAEANPSLGFFLQVSELERAVDSMVETDFRREHLGQWAIVALKRIFDDRMITRASIPAQKPPDDHDATRLGFGIEISQYGTQRYSATVAACWDDLKSGLKIISVIRSEPGVDWLIKALENMKDKFPGSPILFDSKSPGKDLYERFNRDNSIELLPIPWADWVVACSQFLQLINEGLIKVARNPSSLVQDMARVNQKQFGASWVWDRIALNPPASLIAGTAALYANEHADFGEPGVF